MEEIIEHKRDGLTLTSEEIHFFIKNYVNGEIPDYQASALLMAIYFKGMSSYEVSILTKEMRDSGEVWDLSENYLIKSFSADELSDPQNATTMLRDYSNEWIKRG